MTNKEAIELLKPLFDQCKGTDGCLGYIEHYFTKDEEKALDLAIKALEERPKGEWSETKEHFYVTGVCKEWTNFYCSVCDAPSNAPYNFCPNCGADMRGGKE